MSAYDKEILDKHHLKLGENGILSAADQKVYDAQVKINEQIKGAERAMLANSSRAYSSRMSFSPEMERANILYEKTKKYLPTMVKQAGLSGLGVSQSMALQAQNDHLNRMNSLREVRERAASEASGLSFDDYRSYVDGLEEQSRSLDITKAKSDIEALYAGDGDEASKELGFNEILSRYSNSPDVQNSLIEYAKSHQERSSALGKLYSLFGDGTSKGGEVTLADYQAALDAEADPWAGVDAEAFFSKYYELDEKGQATFDDYLEALGAMSVEEKQKELGEKEKVLAEADNAVVMQLLSYGAGYNEDGSLDLSNVSIERAESILNDASVQMSEELRKSLEIAVNVGRGQQMTALEDALKEYFEEVDPEDLDAAGARSYIEELERYLKEEDVPNTDLISEKFYNEHLKPELDSFAEWKKFLKEEATIKADAYNKQMAGEKPIEVDGKKWYVAQSPEGDVEAFMKENEEEVGEALGAYGNTGNPSIPDKTVINIDGVDLLYDKDSGAWYYVETNTNRIHGKTNNVDKITVRGKQYAGNDFAAWRVGALGDNARFLKKVSERDLEYIRLKADDEAKDGTVVATRSGKNAVVFCGNWYYLK